MYTLPAFVVERVRLVTAVQKRVKHVTISKSSVCFDQEFIAIKRKLDTSGESNTNSWHNIRGMNSQDRVYHVDIYMSNSGGVKMLRLA